jgi:hypothetical protein
MNELIHEDCSPSTYLLIQPEQGEGRVKSLSDLPRNRAGKVSLYVVSKELFSMEGLKCQEADIIASQKLSK